MKNITTDEPKLDSLLNQIWDTFLLLIIRILFLLICAGTTLPRTCFLTALIFVVVLKLSRCSGQIETYSWKAHGGQQALSMHWWHTTPCSISPTVGLMTAESQRHGFCRMPARGVNLDRARCHPALWDFLFQFAARSFGKSDHSCFTSLCQKAYTWLLI